MNRNAAEIAKNNWVLGCYPVFVAISAADEFIVGRDQDWHNISCKNHYASLFGSTTNNIADLMSGTPNSPSQDRVLKQ